YSDRQGVFGIAPATAGPRSQGAIFRLFFSLPSGPSSTLRVSFGRQVSGRLSFERGLFVCLALSVLPPSELSSTAKAAFARRASVDPFLQQALLLPRFASLPNEL